MKAPVDAAGVLFRPADLPRPVPGAGQVPMRIAAGHTARGQLVVSIA